jgi:hypothetical protein
LTTGAQRSMSSSTKAVNSSGVLPTLMAPSVLSCSRSLGSLSAATIVACSFSVTAPGSFAGAKTPNHAVD